MYPTGLVMRKTATASGSTTFVTRGGNLRCDCAPSIIAGNEASEDCVLAATACAGAAARAKRRSGTRAMITASGYIATIVSTHIPQSTIRYDAMPPTIAAPVRAAIGRTSANTPIGASHSTQRTMTIIVSAMA